MTTDSATPGTPQTATKAIVAGVVAMILVYLSDNGFTLTGDMVNLLEVVVTGAVTFGTTYMVKNSPK